MGGFYEHKDPFNSNDVPRYNDTEIEDPVMDNTMMWLIIAGVALSVLLCGVGLCLCFKRKGKTPPKGQEEHQGEERGEEEGGDEERGEEEQQPLLEAPQSEPLSSEDKLALNNIRKMIYNGPKVAKAEDIAGNKDVKEAIQAILRAHKNALPGLLGPQESNTGILLYGPHGCGKTHIATWIAHMDDVTFFKVEPSSLVSSNSAQTQKNVEKLFEVAAKFPCPVLFIDEIDLCASKTTIGGQSSSDLTAFKRALLTQMNSGLQDRKGVILLGATNYPEHVDIGLLRRLENKHYIGVPNSKARHEMFQIIKKKNADDFSQMKDAELKTFAMDNDLNNFTFHDLKLLAVEAVKVTVRKVLKDKKVKGKPLVDPLSTLSDAQYTEFVKEKKPVDLSTLKNASRIMKTSVLKSKTMERVTQIRAWERLK